MKRMNLRPGLATLVVLALSLPALADRPGGDYRTICGADEREVASLKPFGRLVREVGRLGCTATMISASCMVTAGHCGGRIAQFNVPPSLPDGNPVSPPPEDHYQVDKIFGRVDGGHGNDWAVYRLAPNATTGEFAGNKQGYLEVSFDPPAPGSALRITGYGKDYKRPERNGSQQTHVGRLRGISATSATISHSVDTEPGNSGSTIVEEPSGKIIGIHTHGGCSGSGGANYGTAVAHRASFRAAIDECLKSEK